MPNKPKIAIVVQRYGLEVQGGAELHARLIAEALKDDYDVEVLTTCAIDYITWENHYRPEIDNVNGITVHRFKTKKKRDPAKFGRFSNKIFRSNHSIAEEHEWLELQGPFSPDLVNFIESKKALFDLFIFFSYRYYHSYFGAKTVMDKSFIVPTAENDPAIKLKIFTEIFNSVKGIIFNSPEEKELIEKIHGKTICESEIIGVGISKVEQPDFNGIKKKFDIDGDYITYIGRIDNNKGCGELFRYFSHYNERKPGLKLVLAGKNIIEIPKLNELIYLGVISEYDKFELIKNAIALVMPSRLESLSMVLLEAWSCSVPVLVNENCRVLAGQCKRSNGGLFYRDMLEFCECLNFLREDVRCRQILGKQGNRYFLENYTWDKIKEKYHRIIDNFLIRKG
jgi:glycosyltransferase involved in cell wall biosynthesis